MIIYLITNTLNNKKYIGKTTKSLDERFRGHINTAKYGSNSYLHRAIRKYGQDNFVTSVLENNISCETILNEREMFWIKKLQPEYNMTSGGEGSSGRVLSEQSRIKMSIKSKNRIRKPHSEETRHKIAKALSGVPLTEERKKNISKSKMGNIPWNKGKKLNNI